MPSVDDLNDKLEAIFREWEDEEEDELAPLPPPGRVVEVPVPPSAFADSLRDPSPASDGAQKIAREAVQSARVPRVTDLPRSPLPAEEGADQEQHLRDLARIEDANGAVTETTPRAPVKSGPDWKQLQQRLLNAQMRANGSRAAEQMFANISPGGYRTDPGRFEGQVKAAELPLELARQKQTFEKTEQGLDAQGMVLQRSKEMSDPNSAVSKRARDSFKTFFGPNVPPDFDSFSAVDVEKFVEDPAAMMLKLRNARDLAALRQKPKVDKSAAESEADKNVRAALEASGLYTDWIQKQKDAGVWDTLTAKQLKQLLAPVETDRQQPNKVAVAVASHEGKHEADVEAARVEGIPTGWEVDPGFTPTNDDKKKFKDVLSTSQRIRTNIEKLRNVNSKGNAVTRRTDSQLRTELKGLVQAIKDDIRVLKNFGVPSGKDMEQIANSIADPTEISLQTFMTDVPTQLRVLDEQLDNAIASEAQGKFRRASSASAEAPPARPAPGVKPAKRLKNPFLE